MTDNSVQFLRTAGAGPPQTLRFGEPAYSDADESLHIGKADGTTLSVPLALLGGNLDIAIFQEQYSSGQSPGGIPQSNAWFTRPLNTQMGTLGTLSNSTIRLSPGRYWATGWAITLEATSSQARLRSRDGQQVFYGMSGFSNHYSLPNLVEAVFQIATETDFQLQLKTNPGQPKSWGQGHRVAFGNTELYSSITFIKF